MLFYRMPITAFISPISRMDFIRFFLMLIVKYLLK